ncbi:hypothetical protein GCM10027020_36320 [Nocardioides salsibiostraticola]
MKYRPEIDGLRAFAVVVVILFHASLGPLPGGFIGVDIFFVLSGYLITTIILNQFSEGTFTFSGFWERRARRILPALIFVCLACVPFAYAWMLPDELQNFGQSLLATGFSANNVLLSTTSGYWDLDSNFKPLLHTWSLGVEEQYYLIAPLLLFVVSRYARRALLPVVAGLGLLSLGLAEFYLQRNPNFAFYMLPTRAWELAAGAVVSMVLLRNPTIREHRGAPFAAAAGLVMITLPVFTFGENTPTPGVAMLLPVGGVCLLILGAHAERGVGRLLATPALVRIGLISYSAYLWHQPLFVFARIYAKDTPPAWVFGLLSVLTFGLAWLTWKFVETPFRSRRTTSRSVVFAACGVGVAAMAVSGLGLHITKGVPSRLPFATGSTYTAESTIAYNVAVFALKQDEFVDDGRRKVLVAGDSFARDFINSVNESFTPAQLATVEVVYRNDYPICVAEATGAHQALYDDADVVISARAIEPCIEENLSTFTGDNKPFVVIGTKHFGGNLDWLMRMDNWADQVNAVPEHVTETETSLQAEVPPGNYVSWLDAVARDGEIPITDGVGVPLTFDRLHLSKAGAIYFGARALPGSAAETAFFGRLSNLTP